MPIFKSKHGSPIEPKRRIKDFFIKYILYGLVIQVFILCHKQLHNLHAALLTQIKFSIRMSILTTIYRCSTQGIIRILLIQPVILIQNGYSRCFNRRYAMEQIPQTFEMVLHLTTTTHYITSCRIKNTITCTACNIHCFQNVNIFTRHLTVSYQEAGCCKSC